MNIKDVHIEKAQNGFVIRGFEKDEVLETPKVWICNSVNEVFEILSDILTNPK